MDNYQKVDQDQLEYIEYIRQKHQESQEKTEEEEKEPSSKAVIYFKHLTKEIVRWTTKEELLRLSPANCLMAPLAGLKRYFVETTVYVEVR